MRPALSRNVAASVLNACAAVATSLLTVPLILDAVGTAGYGVWTLGLALVLYASILETGLGPGVQRFTAFARGRRDEEALSRIAVTTLVAFYALLGVRRRPRPVRLDRPIARRPLRPPAAAPARRRGDVPHPRRRARTHVAGRRCGRHLAQGLERFGVLALSTAAGAVAFLAAVVVLARRHGLPGLAVAVCIGQAVTLIARSAVLAPGGDPPTPHAKARAPAALRLLRSPAGHGVFRARQLAERQAGCRPRRLARHPGPARHRRAVRGWWEVAGGRSPLPVHTTFAHLAGSGDEAGLHAALRRAPPGVDARPPGRGVVGAASFAR